MGRAMPPAVVEAQAEDEEGRLRRLLEKSDGSERVATVREEMQQAMETGVGIYRDRAGLEKAADRLGELRERFERVALDDRSLTFNTELVSALELGNMLDVAESVVHSALERRESRGAHQRTDHPERNDEDYLTHSLAYRSESGRPRIELLPVTVTRWPPGERVYGR
jgi:fumarate reductase flavoprotein subunit